MTTPTHIAAYVLISNLFGLQIRSIFTLWGIAGCLLPDISNPYGGIGKVIKPLSNFISQQWGHRTITHSWVFITITTAIALIFKIISDENGYWLLPIGVCTHIVLDMVNISGVKFFYPDSIAVVMPSEYDVRIGTGSKREKRLAFGIATLALITLPLGIWGYESTIRFIAGSHTAATEEYKKFIDQYEVFVEVTNGINRITQSPVRNKRFRVVAALPKKITLVETEDGKRVTIGQTEEAIIETKKMKVYKGVPVQVQITNIEVTDWKQVITELESPYSYAIGTVRLTERPDNYRPETDQWEGIEIHGNVIYLQYSGINAVRKIAMYQPVEGKLKIRKEVSSEGIVARLTEARQDSFRTVSLIVDTPFEGLKVKEGVLVRKGDIVAVHPEAWKVQADIETLRASIKTKATEEDRADALMDRSLSIIREIEQHNRLIEVQKRVVDKASAEFIQGEQARLDKFIQVRDNLQKELEEVQRSLKEQKEYITNKKAAIIKEIEQQIAALEVKKETFIRRSPYSGKIIQIKQRGPQIFEVFIEIG